MSTTLSDLIHQAQDTLACNPPQNDIQFIIRVSELAKELIPSDDTELLQLARDSCMSLDPVDLIRYCVQARLLAALALFNKKNAA